MVNQSQGKELGVAWVGYTSIQTLKHNSRSGDATLGEEIADETEIFEVTIKERVPKIHQLA